MASRHNRPLTDEIREYNQRLDTGLKRTVGISLQSYKVVKNVTQLVGAAAGIYAMHLGADPMMTFALIAGIIMGPEAVEYAITNDPGGNGGQ